MLRRSAIRREAIGFIGLGQMGARMAPNLFKHGDDTKLFVFDTNEKALEQIPYPDQSLMARTTFCKTPAEVAANCKKIVTMLPNGQIVRKVFTDAETGIFAKVQPGTLICDSSTVDPNTPKSLSQEAAKKNVQLFDAPVSGGVNAAAGGILTFMVGAPTEDAFNEAQALLGPMSKAVTHCGDVGAGQVAKLCNNLILAQHMISVSEAMLVGTKLGVDPKKLAGIFNTSTGRCWSSDSYNPYPGVMENVPASKGYAGGFGAKLMLKDLGLALQAAEDAKVTVRGANNAQQMYTEMCQNENLGDLDFGAMLKFINEKL